MRNSMTARSLATRFAVAVALAGSVLATGCIHVSQRAWDNGRAMQASYQYQDVLAGDVNPKTLRGLYYNANGFSLAFRNSPRYAPFGNW